MSWGITNTSFQPMVAVNLNADAVSSPIHTDDWFNLSFQPKWTGVSGSPINGVITLEVSNVLVPDPSFGSGDWNTKTGTAINITSASGSDEVSLNGTISERWIRVKWTKNNVSAGLLTVYANGR